MAHERIPLTDELLDKIDQAAKALDERWPTIQKEITKNASRRIIDRIGQIATPTPAGTEPRVRGARVTEGNKRSRDTVTPILAGSSRSCDK